MNLYMKFMKFKKYIIYDICYRLQNIIILELSSFYAIKEFFINNNCTKTLNSNIININRILNLSSNTLLMEFQNQKVSIEVSTAISKIDQLLRLYQMCKKTDPTKKVQIQKKINDLLSNIKNQPIYAKIEVFLSRCVQTGLQQPKAPAKVQRQASNVSSIKSSNNISIQKSRDKQGKNMSDASVSNNLKSQQNSLNKGKIFGSMEMGNSSQNLSNSNQGLKKPQQIVSIQKNFQTPPSMNSASSGQLSNQKSEDSFQMMIDTVQSICQNYQNKIQQTIAINQDIFSNIKQTQDNSLIYLFGVNSPQRNYNKKLYVCTLMKFSQYQVVNCSAQTQNKFNKQYKMFENNLRSPFGLIMNGKSIQDIKIQHIKFLVDMGSFCPVIILLENWKDRNGLFYQFDRKTSKLVKGLNKVQFQKQTLNLRKQYGEKGIQLGKVEIVKQKVVITKNLTRAITNLIESAQNAIQIQSSNDNIKQQPNRFPYKLHTKYFVSSKSDYQLFFLDNQTLAFKWSFKQKQFENFKKFVMQEAHHKGAFLLSTSVLKQTSQIKKQFFKLVYQCKTRDQYFLVNLSGITSKKTIILSLKQNIVNQQDIMNAPPILFSSLQKPTQLLNVVAVVTKLNYKQFETDNKVQVIDLTSTAKKK